MKNRWSYLSILIIGIVLMTFRLSYPRGAKETMKVTTWDAFGYYMYNPSIFIYGDVSELKWVPKIEEKYDVTGGELYQASQLDNGKYTNKYLGGVAIMQVPFFFTGHAIATLSDYPADGFSAPYQYAIAFGAIFYCLLGLFILKKVLSRYFRDGPIAITLLLLGLGTNLVQYAAIDGGQSHMYIFPLYSLILWVTIKWHENPHWKWAALIGLIIGLATICRPTELIMLFIPLLWNTHEKEVRKEKWQLVRKHLPHLGFVLGFGLLGILPQLMYWQYTTGSLIHNVGSKWFFFNPWFRVLFGVTNGFFVYTPIALLFIVGFFFMKKYPFKRSVLTFCLLNIWIIISWSDWRYGATFSTRAMVQSYPVFALTMCSAVTVILEKKILRLVVLNLGAFFIYANIFQITQYNASVLHPHDMNWSYYSRIYLNPNPTPLDFSLLDTEEIIDDESDYDIISSIDWPDPSIEYDIIGDNSITQPFMEGKASFLQISVGEMNPKNGWIKVETKIRADKGFSGNYIAACIAGNDPTLIRLKRPLAVEGAFNEYAFYYKLPQEPSSTTFCLYLEGWEIFEGEVAYLRLTSLEKK